MASPLRPVESRPPALVTPAPPKHQAVPAEMHHATQDLESLFMATLLKTMHETVQQMGGDEEKSAGSDMMREMMDEQLATALSKRGGLGIAKMLEAQLTARMRLQPDKNEDPAGR